MLLRLFSGFDQREAIGWHTFAQSVIENTSAPVAHTALAFDDGLCQRDGTNAFTYARFLVPYLCGFQGHAIFADGADMVAVGDLAELWAKRVSQDGCAVQVVKHDYQTKFPRKYVGTEMEAANEAYPRKNWSSLILWDCGHHMNRCLTPEFVKEKTGAYLHRFSWLPDDRIAELPAEWNWLCDEYGANTSAKVLHWTAGIPGIYAHRNAPQGQMWRHMRAKSQEMPAERRIAEVASQR